MPLQAILTRSMSATGGIILLSSSPSRIFARSPSPADISSSSPALPSPGAIFASQRSQGARDPDSGKINSVSWLQGHQTFKTTTTRRDGFGSNFSSSRTLPLKEVPSKRNLPVSKRSASNKIGEKAELEKPKQRAPPSLAGGQSSGRGKQVDKSVPREYAHTSPQDDSGILSPAPKLHGPSEPSPLGIGKAVRRRLDWTPPASPAGQTSLDPAALSLPGGLIDSFGHDKPLPGPQASEVVTFVDEGMATKRRRLDVVNSRARASATVEASEIQLQAGRATTIAARKRNKSPKKKSTTITGIATCHYFGKERSEASPMMQYLSATQQRAQDMDTDSVPDTAKRKRAVKKSRVAKKPPTKSALLSPRSVMKTLQEQESVFGSASQLAQDEPPSLIRDTVQAIRQSEDTLFMSDPLSTQITIPSSQPAETPDRQDKRGVSRFVKSRNLWSVAGRDDDNALLQVDTVDMFDSPDIRTAFAGKDVLLEPGAPRFRGNVSIGKQTPGQPDPIGGILGSHSRPSSGSGGDGLQRFLDVGGLIDIDQIGLNTPVPATRSGATSQARGVHTAAVRNAVLESEHFANENLRPDRAHESQPANAKGPRSTKPPFVGLTTSQLASQLAAYGFKPIKKREKMIEVLDRCWNEKHNLVADADMDAPASVDQAVELSHGDFLTKVHDVSSRPTARPKKPRARPRKDDPSSADKSAARKPQSRKSIRETMTAEEMVVSETTKVAKKTAQPRARRVKDGISKSSVSTPSKRGVKVKKPKKPPLSEEYILDIDEVDADGHGIHDGVTEHQSDTIGVMAAAVSAQTRHASPAPARPPAIKTTRKVKAVVARGKVVGTVDDTSASASASASASTSNSTSTSSKSPAPATATTSTTAEVYRNTSSASSSSSSLPSSSPHPQPDLSTQITLAITTITSTTSTTSSPPSTSTSTPSHSSQLSPTFHQKILMYDPIILEDVAAWLNTVGFKAIGEDREVGPLEVRAWCEERGVCCLWRGGWRGGKMKNG